MANKQERIATLIRKNIAEIIQIELKNPHLGFVSIPEVKVSKDISYAKVYVSFFDEKQEKKASQPISHRLRSLKSSIMCKAFNLFY